MIGGQGAPVEWLLHMRRFDGAGEFKALATAGRLQAVQIDDAGMLRQVMLPTSVTRPMTLACRAVMELATELIRQRVASGDWPGRWIGQDGGV